MPNRRPLAALAAASAALASLSAAAPALAQQPLPDSAPSPSRTALPASDRICFRGRPQPTCASFWITELAYSRRVAGSSTSQSIGSSSFRRVQLPSYLSWEVGGMRNVAGRRALGATAMLGLDGDGVRLGAKARYRQWYAGDVSFDVAAGPVSAIARVPVESGDEAYTYYGSPRSVRAAGLTADVAVGVGDRVGLKVGADLLYARGRPITSLYVTPRLGSKTAVAGTSVLAVAVGLLVAAYVNSDY